MAKGSSDTPHRRLQNWSYSKGGLYFVTFCTVDRSPLLGRIASTANNTEVSVKFLPSNIGAACIEAIDEINEANSDAAVEAFAIMPNHVHLLIGLDSRIKSEPAMESRRLEKIPLLVSKVKAYGTRAARQEGIAARIWQRSFHDHIVRSEEEADRIRKYIAENPLKWALDRFYVIA